MSLSTLTTTVTLPLRGEPEVVASLEEVLESYKSWAPASVALHRAIDEEAAAFDVFISRIGPAIDAGLSHRETVRQMEATGEKITLTFTDKNGKVKSSTRFPNTNDIGVWQAVWHLMRDGDVDAGTARRAMTGVNSTGSLTSKEVRAVIAEASAAGRDVTKAVEDAMSPPKTEGEPKAPKPFDADKTLKEIKERMALLAQHEADLTPAQRGDVAGIGFTAQSIIG
jgi:hypothetical protein